MEKVLCQICHTRIAEHSFVRVVNGVSTTYRVCSHCKALMDNKYKELQEQAVLRNTPPEERVCPVCGMRLNDFLSTGLLGCDNCYRVFEDYLVEYIRGYHGAIRHVGMDATPPPPTDVEELYRDLKAALDRKDYETAAKLKEKIDRVWGEAE